MGDQSYFILNTPACLEHAGFSNPEIGANIFQLFAGISLTKKHFYISAQSRFFPENKFHFIEYILPFITTGGQMIEGSGIACSQGTSHYRSFLSNVITNLIALYHAVC